VVEDSNQAPDDEDVVQDSNNTDHAWFLRLAKKK
jgi:hypothetical protein